MKLLKRIHTSSRCIIISNDSTITDVRIYISNSMLNRSRTYSNTTMAHFDRIFRNFIVIRAADILVLIIWIEIIFFDIIFSVWFRFWFLSLSRFLTERIERLPAEWLRFLFSLRTQFVFKTLNGILLDISGFVRIKCIVILNTWSNNGI